jgi:hypothetical protein
MIPRFVIELNRIEKSTFFLIELTGLDNEIVDTRLIIVDHKRQIMSSTLVYMHLYWPTGLAIVHVRKRWKPMGNTCLSMYKW